MRQHGQDVQVWDQGGSDRGRRSPDALEAARQGHGLQST